MTKVALFSAILWTTTIAMAQSAQAPHGTWLQDGIKWSKAPKKINPKLSSGRAAIAYFGPNYTFALIYATVNRVQGEDDLLCNGCGQVIYMGSWKLGDKTVKVKYRLVNRTVQVSGEQLPGPFKEATAKIEGVAILLLGYSFHRSAALDVNVGEFLPSTTLRGAPTSEPR